MPYVGIIRRNTGRGTQTQESSRGHARSMTYKLRHVIVFFFTLFLGAVAMYVEMDPLLRVLVAALLVGVFSSFGFFYLQASTCSMLDWGSLRLLE